MSAIDIALIVIALVAVGVAAACALQLKGHPLQDQLQLFLRNLMMTTS